MHLPQLIEAVSSLFGPHRTLPSHPTVLLQKSATFKTIARFVVSRFVSSLIEFFWKQDSKIPHKKKNNHKKEILSVILVHLTKKAAADPFIAPSWLLSSESCVCNVVVTITKFFLFLLFLKKWNIFNCPLQPMRMWRMCSPFHSTLLNKFQRTKRWILLSIFLSRTTSTFQS